jgi:hypothetical protein
MTKAYFWSIVAQAGGDQASEYRVAIKLPVLRQRKREGSFLEKQSQS